MRRFWDGSTPVLPRLSATLLEPAIAAVMDKDEVQLPDAMTTADELAQRLGARAMPIAGEAEAGCSGECGGDGIGGVDRLSGWNG